jgi:hypothetical protein
MKAEMIEMYVDNHNLKNRTGDRTGEVVGLGFYRLDHWFSGSLSGFLKGISIFVPSGR